MSINSKKLQLIRILSAGLILAGLAACKPKQRTHAAMVTGMTGIVEISGAEVEKSKRTLSYEQLGKDPARFSQGERLRTDENSNADLTFVGNVFVRIASESNLLLSGSKLLDGDKFENLVFDLNQGALAYKSNKLPAAASVTVKTPTAVASVRGTEFLLIHEEGQTALLVQEGSVAVGPPGAEPTTPVEAGQKAIIETGKEIQVGASLPEERERVKRFLAGLGDPNRKGLDEKKEFGTDAAIRSHYGELHRVTMEDGRSYTGYVAQHGDLVKVHTTYGVIEIPDGEIQSITEVQ